MKEICKITTRQICPECNLSLIESNGEFSSKCCNVCKKLICFICFQERSLKFIFEHRNICFECRGSKERTLVTVRKQSNGDILVTRFKGMTKLINRLDPEFIEDTKSWIFETKHLEEILNQLETQSFEFIDEVEIKQIN